MNQEILNLLKSEDPSHRRAALEELQDQNSKEYLEYFLEYLSDDNVGVQEVCVDALIEIKSAKSIAPLIKNLYTENVPLRNACQEILSMICHLDTDQMIQNLFKDDDVSKFILDSLLLNITKINFSDQQIKSIEKGLSSDNENIIGATIEILAEHNTDETWEILFEECKKENEWTQYSVLKALSLKAPDKIETLYEEILKNHLTPSVTMFMKTQTK